MRFASILIIGILAGWIVGKITRGEGYGLAGNLLIGLIGSWAGSFIFGMTGLAVQNALGSVVMSVVGALALLFFFRALRSGRSRKNKVKEPA
jgi:uncharacterized membrane protein YeaQ/YmgE (transglycosylase-associated protein family)